ncbi:helix-turn-helix transcriptional regulator [Enterococcus faecalis]|uniref:helix-turn-helix transcriptional regulator n=1 Tax=Enterococcus faecalis TaxID=1351 RepID=UPI0028529338|nr:helix-turn-helix transcriptional regulator [Enterococcus faecalis]
MGFDVSYLGRIERGKSANIPISTLEKIISALNEGYSTFFSFGNKKIDKLQFFINY